jgi:hypothetical protein
MHITIHALASMPVRFFMTILVQFLIFAWHFLGPVQTAAVQRFVKRFLQKHSAQLSSPTAKIPIW